MDNISVVIPLYNKASHISRALSSVLRQEYPHFEVIVVDDGSTDNGPNVVKTMADARVQLVSQTNQGVSEARNVGIRKACSDYVAFLDADDSWEPEFLSTISKLIEKYPNAGAYALNYYVVSRGGRRREAKIKSMPPAPWNGLLPNYFQSIATGANPVWSSAVCVKKSTFESVGFFEKGINLYEDLQMWTNIALKFPIAFSTSVGATYHRDAENRACNIVVPDTKVLPFEITLMSAVATMRDDPETIRYARQFICKYKLLNAFKCVVAGERSRAGIIARQADPVNLEQLARKLFVVFLSHLPDSCIRYIWRSGVAIKGQIF